MITNYERQYMEALTRIYNEGYSDGTNERTGIKTKRLPCIVITVDVEQEFPILKSKFVAAKTAQREIEWIWKLQSNNINDLKAKIWDEWADEDGSIGRAYGYQMAKPVDIYTDPIHKTPESFRHYDNQAKFVIEYLREFPNGRWANVTLWSVEDLKVMNLVPCCHTITFNLDGGRLNCVLDQRSGDMPYGVPFNTTQYAEIMCMIAKDLGVKPGILTHVITDAHIYANQMEGVEEQIRYYHFMHLLEVMKDSLDEKELLRECFLIAKDYNWDITAEQLLEHFKEVLECVPKYHIPKDDIDFFKMTADTSKVTDYKYIRKIDFGSVAV